MSNGSLFSNADDGVHDAASYEPTQQVTKLQFSHAEGVQVWGEIAEASSRDV